MPTKICTKCKEPKDVSEFSKNKCRKDGLGDWCKSCIKRYRDDHKEEMSASGRKYYKANRKSDR